MGELKIWERAALKKIICLFKLRFAKVLQISCNTRGSYIVKKCSFETTPCTMVVWSLCVPSDCVSLRAVRSFGLWVISMFFRKTGGGCKSQYSPLAYWAENYLKLEFLSKIFPYSCVVQSFFNRKVVLNCAKNHICYPKWLKYYPQIIYD